MTATANAAQITQADLRAQLGRSNLKYYVVAGRAEINPAHLSAILNERAPLSEGLAQRILQAVKDK